MLTPGQVSGRFESCTKNMRIIRVITTILIVLMMMVVGFFLYGARDDEASVVGFSAMEAVYLLALVSIWA